MVNAGHLPLLIVSPGSDRQLIASNAPALGLLPDARFDARTVPLVDGALVVAYSDGVTESRNAEGMEFEEERLIAAAERCAAGTASEVCDGVIRAVRDHVGTEPAADDITILVIKKTRVRQEPP